MKLFIHTNLFFAFFIILGAVLCSTQQASAANCGQTFAMSAEDTLGDSAMAMTSSTTKARSSSSTTSIGESTGSNAISVASCGGSGSGSTSSTSSSSSSSGDYAPRKLLVTLERGKTQEDLENLSLNDTYHPTIEPAYGDQAGPHTEEWEELMGGNYLLTFPSGTNIPLMATQYRATEPVRLAGKLGYGYTDSGTAGGTGGVASTCGTVDTNQICSTLETNGAAVSCPVDQHFFEQANLHNYGLNNTWVDADIDAPEAWFIHRGDESAAGAVTVAVIDSGVDSTHPDFVGRLLPGRNTISDGDPLNDENTTDDSYISHGTSVSGIIAANGDNTEGITGIHRGASILPMKACFPDPVYPTTRDKCDTLAVANAILWAVGQDVSNSNPAQVINISLQFYDPNIDADAKQQLQNAVRYAYLHGTVVVAAAGNQRGQTIAYPAKFEEAIAVSATTLCDTFAPVSNYGSKVEISAPGETIWTTSRMLNGGYTGAFGATSAAASHVSAVAALAKSYKPCLTSYQIRDLLDSTADDLGALDQYGNPVRDTKFGYGRLNAYKALQAATCNNSIPAPASSAQYSYGGTLGLAINDSGQGVGYTIATDIVTGISKHHGYLWKNAVSGVSTIAFSPTTAPFYQLMTTPAPEDTFHPSEPYNRVKLTDINNQGRMLGMSYISESYIAESAAYILSWTGTQWSIAAQIPPLSGSFFTWGESMNESATPYVAGYATFRSTPEYPFSKYRAILYSSGTTIDLQNTVLQPFFDTELSTEVVHSYAHDVDMHSRVVGEAWDGTWRAYLYDPVAPVGQPQVRLLPNNYGPYSAKATVFSNSDTLAQMTIAGHVYEDCVNSACAYNATVWEWNAASNDFQMTELPHLFPGDSMVTGMNDKNQVVGMTFGDSGLQAMVWEKQGSQWVVSLVGNGAVRADGINNQGHITGNKGGSTGYQGYAHSVGVPN